ncbi:hypothetical protein [Verrucomicrobium spinosum]|uniref:hypothetical protein n=1 Tax=Verrucomicrobium spinosum TaxID=2736 RepID=UPI0001745362|nr:hypothetical protein [Verrucomicrobium spinosum]
MSININKSVPQPGSPKYFVQHDGKEQGPFGMNFVEGMVLAGVFPGGVLVRESSSNEWKPVVSSMARLKEIKKPHSAGQMGLPRCWKGAIVLIVIMMAVGACFKLLWLNDDKNGGRRASLTPTSDALWAIGTQAHRGPCGPALTTDDTRFDRV